jgi:hypothetical protein
MKSSRYTAEQIAFAMRQTVRGSNSRHPDIKSNALRLYPIDKALLLPCKAPLGITFPRSQSLPTWFDK